jgi:hypothetical protein
LKGVPVVFGRGDTAIYGDIADVLGVDGRVELELFIFKVEPPLQLFFDVTDGFEDVKVIGVVHLFLLF